VDIQATLDTSLAVRAASLSVLASDAPTITSDVAAASLAVGVGLTSVGAGVAIGVALAENVIEDTVKASINNATDVKIAGSVAVHATETASVTSSSVAASLALSGAGANVTNLVNNDVEATISNSQIEANLYADFAAAGNTQPASISKGQRVALDVSTIFEYIGDTPLPVTADGLAAVAYSDPEKWRQVAAADVDVRANSAVSAKATVVAAAAAVSGGIGAVSGSIGAATGYNLIGVRDSNVDLSDKAGSNKDSTTNPDALPDAVTGDALQNKVIARIEGSTIGATGNVQVLALSSATVQADVGAGSMALAIGLGGAAAGAGVGVSNFIASKVDASVSDSSMLAIKDVVIHAVDTSAVTHVRAVGASLAAGVVGIAVSASKVDNDIANHVSASLTGDSSHQILVGNDLVVDANGDLDGTGSAYAAGAGTIDDVSAVAAALSAGYVSASGQAIVLDNQVANTVTGSIAGGLSVNAGGDVMVHAEDAPSASADLKGVALAASPGRRRGRGPGAQQGG